MRASSRPREQRAPHDRAQASLNDSSRHAERHNSARLYPKESPVSNVGLMILDVIPTFEAARTHREHALEQQLETLWELRHNSNEFPSYLGTIRTPFGRCSYQRDCDHQIDEVYRPVAPRRLVHRTMTHTLRQKRRFLTSGVAQ